MREKYLENSSNNQRSYHQGYNRVSAERLNIETGSLLVIDQYILGCTRLLEATLALGREMGLNQDTRKEKLAEIVSNFGGILFDLPQGKYQVLRDAHNRMLAVVSLIENEEINLERLCQEITLQHSKGENAFQDCGAVLIDTRCAVFCDAGILTDSSVLNRYRQLRAQGGEKPARDSLRESGAAVRYGFSRSAEELNAWYSPGGQVIAPISSDNEGGSLQEDTLRRSCKVHLTLFAS